MQAKLIILAQLFSTGSCQWFLPTTHQEKWLNIDNNRLVRQAKIDPIWSFFNNGATASEHLRDLSKFPLASSDQKLPTSLSRLNEYSGGCEKIEPVSESFWSNLMLLRMIDLTAWLWW